MASQGVSKVFRKVLGPFLKLLGYSGGFRKLQGRSWDVPYGFKGFPGMFQKILGGFMCVTGSLLGDPKVTGSGGFQMFSRDFWCVPEVFHLGIQGVAEVFQGVLGGFMGFRGVSEVFLGIKRGFISWGCKSVPLIFPGTLGSLKGFY